MFEALYSATVAGDTAWSSQKTVLEVLQQYVFVFASLLFLPSIPEASLMIP